MQFQFNITVWVITISITIDLFDLDPSDCEVQAGINVKVTW